MTPRSTLSRDLTSFAGRPLAIPIEDDWVSVAEAGAELGLTHSLTAQLMASELVADFADTPGPHVIRSGGRLLMPRRDLQLLADRQPVTGEPDRFINVRVGPGTIDTPPIEGRTYLGFHSSYTPAQRSLATTRWWSFSEEEAWIGHPFVASLAGFVVLCGRIAGTRATRATQGGRRLVAFDVDETDPLVDAAFTGRRIPVFPGGPALKVGSV